MQNKKFKCAITGSAEIKRILTSTLTCNVKQATRVRVEKLFWSDKILSAAQAWVWVQV